MRVCYKRVEIYISDGVQRPDPERMKPITNLPNPSKKKELQRVIGMFSCNAKWLPQFSEKDKTTDIGKQLSTGEKAIKASSF